MIKMLDIYIFKKGFDIVVNIIMISFVVLQKYIIDYIQK
jgi:hypothetical protein